MMGGEGSTLEERRLNRLRDELVFRGLVALLIFVFNEMIGISGNGDPHRLIRVVSLIGLLINIPYYVIARVARGHRPQAYARMIVDILFITFGLYSAGGLAAASYVGVYSVVPVYVGIGLSSPGCLAATGVATACYLAVAAAQQAGWLGLPPEPPGAWIRAAFNLLILVVVGSLTAYLAEAYRRTRRQAQESEARFRALAQAAVDAIVFTDGDGMIVSCNRSTERMFGYTMAELLGRPLCRLLPAYDFAAHEREPGEMLVGGEPGFAGATVELRGHRKNDEEFPAELSASSWMAGERRFCGAIIRDITRRRLAEETIRQSEERFRTLFEQSPVGVYRATPDGRIVLANPAIVRMLGYDSPDELVAEVIPRDGNGADIDGAMHGVDVQWKRKDGTVVFARENRQAIRARADGQVLYYDGTVEDITERKNLEVQLRQSQKMEAVGQLAGGVAHDFNNLLTAIAGYGDLIGMRSGEQDFVRRGAQEISAAAGRAASLTRQLLAFSRRQTLQPILLDPGQVVRKMEDMFRRLIGEDIDFVIVTDPGEYCVKADAGQLEQVILNLVVNARDAMPHGGRLTIETANVELDDRYARAHVDVTPGRYVRVCVSDTGIGMDAKTQARIFEPFFTTKTADNGTGLGLATVYGIVKQTGGSIQVYSELGHGSTFRVYLPAVAGDLAPARAAPPTEAPRGTETILLVEDDDGVRTFVRESLIASGYTVLAARHGDEALGIAASHHERIHLMVTDFVMPHMTGRDLARHFASLRPDMKVLFMSGYTARHSADDTEADLEHFLSKPFGPDALALKVRDVLDAVAPV